MMKRRLEMLRKKRMPVFILFAGLVMAACVDSDTVQIDKKGEDRFEYKEIMTTYVYKQAGVLKIKADVFQVHDRVARPVVVWIHGGSLMAGGRDSVPKWLKKRMFTLGYDIVSPDYRLAPETKLPEIIEDLEDFFKWIQEQGPSKLGLDPSRIAVVGDSGYLALTAGYRIKPRPKVIVSYWGYGDLIGFWLREPNTERPFSQSKMEEEIFKAFPQSPPVANQSDREGNGNAFYNHCRKLGLWPLMVSGWDPQAEPEKYYPYMPLKNVTEDFPPTFLIHGTADPVVPHEQSELMVQEFKKHNVPHEFFSIEGGGHGVWRTPREAQARSQDLLVEFIERHMKK